MTKALIIGGGIAGAVTAMALQKAGITSEVFEAYPTGADDVGAFLIVFANGLEALRVIDAHGPVVDHSFPAQRVEFHGNDGARLGDRPIAGTEQGDGLGPRTLRRATLYQVLHAEAARRGIPVRHGKRLVGAETVATAGGKRVVATFADGSSAEGDLLIGADGLHSVTRTLIDPAAPQPRYTGQNTVCGYTRDAADVPLSPDTYTMIFGKRAFFGCTRAPDGEVWWFANVPGTELDRTALPATPPDAWRTRVAGLFADDDTVAATLVRATGDRIIASNAYDIATTPTWHTDTMVVLGDAAHAAAPNAAQGASMAIEDGVVLAKCLRDQPDPRSAFSAYEKLRRDRVEKVVAASAGMAKLTAAGTGRPSRPEGAERGSGAGADNWLTGYRIDW